ncbi:Transposase IS116/IS110/IS902 family protein [compost metagenome]
MWGDLRTLDERVGELDSEISAIAASEPTAVRLQQLRGVGLMIATALVAAIGDARQFANGRQLAASLGLTPRQHSSGGKDRLLGISKRGDAYLRTLMIHGARSALRTAKFKDDRLSQWAVRLAERSHPNVAAIALANKTARMAWAMLRTGNDYQADRAAACPIYPRRSTSTPRLRSNPNNGKPVEPASEKPSNDQMRKARRSNWEPTRE